MARRDEGDAVAATVKDGAIADMGASQRPFLERDEGEGGARRLPAGDGLARAIPGEARGDRREDVSAEPLDRTGGVVERRMRLGRQPGRPAARAEQARLAKIGGDGRSRRGRRSAPPCGPRG
jgi:hypothetical protein